MWGDVGRSKDGASELRGKTMRLAGATTMQWLMGARRCTGAVEWACGVHVQGCGVLVQGRASLRTVPPVEPPKIIIRSSSTAAA